MVQKGRGDVLGVPYLVGYMCRIPYGKVIYAGSLFWLLAWLEGGVVGPCHLTKGREVMWGRCRPSRPGGLRLG